MNAGRLIWGSPDWLMPTAIALTVLVILVVWAYWRRWSTVAVRSVAAGLKVLAIVAIAVCIVEPLFTGTRPRPGANLFLVVADNSESVTVRDRPGKNPRSDQLRAVLKDETPWLARLGQDFELRRYLVDSRLRSTDSFQALKFDGHSSTLGGALATLAGQYGGRPVAGVLLLTDGIPTDWNESRINWQLLPPIYPVPLGENRLPRDVCLKRISVSQTNFETMPVTIQADIACQGIAGEELVLQLLDESSREIQRHTVTAPHEGKPLVHRFEFRPERPGASFYTVRAVAAAEEKTPTNSGKSREATLANNSRLAMVDRGRGPYRVLYVSGRPNWEFKFLRRAVAEDAEVQLIGLVRIAKKEPRFSFRGRTGETTNPLFRGFDNQSDQSAEQYDEPVLIRLGTQDPAELRDGFPKTADQLFPFHAVVLDDVEVDYFTRDQMSLLQQFVSQRGGALIMLGGQESFGGGGYARTPIGDMLPIYVERTRSALPPGEYRLAISREGWLQPWVRLRTTEQEEEHRLAALTPFRVWNAAASIKPGATVLIYAQRRELAPGPAPGNIHPALVVQRFGHGQTAALLVGDLWRWGMRRDKNDDSDLAQAWRQTIRWLVSDVPQRVSVQTKPNTRHDANALELRVTVRDESYQPLDNADVKCHVQSPDGKQIELTATPVEDKAGEYAAEFVPRSPGAYHIAVVAKSADGHDVGTCETGTVHEPAVDEFRELRSNRELLQRIAERTGGEMIDSNGLDRFAASLPNRKIPITEPWIYPLWHQWSVLGLALVCLVGEWSVRRWKGLP